MGVRRLAVANGPNIFQMLLVQLSKNVGANAAVVCLTSVSANADGPRDAA